MTRLAYLGTPTLAVGPLEALVAAGHEVVLVISQPDAKRGRGGALAMTPVKAAARTMGLATSDDLNDLDGLDVDLAIVVAYGRLIPTSLLGQMPMINIHFSLLPRWRGAAPVERAILAGDEETGVAIMAVEPDLDTGGVYATWSTPVGTKTLIELQTELAARGAELLVSIVDTWMTKRPSMVPQVGEPTYAHKIRADELELDFAAPATISARTIRLGRAFTFIGEKRLRVLAAEVVEHRDEPPGTLTDTTVATSHGALRLLMVQPEGKRPIEADAWRRGVHASSAVLLGREPVIDGDASSLGT